MMALTSLWLEREPLILASGSSVRAQMLDRAGIPVDVQPADVDERATEESVRGQATSVAAVALALAHAKAEAVSLPNPGRWVLGADQTLECAGAMFHKSPDMVALSGQLGVLSGRTHRLDSAAVLMRDGVAHASVASHATMTMRPFGQNMIGRYLAAAGDAILGSVGGYHYEGVGIQLFDKVEGDHSTILGLPLLALLARMRQLGILAS